MMQQPTPSALLRPAVLAPRGWLNTPADRCMTAPGVPPACARVDIAAEDWDMLFRAALDLLARVAVPDPSADDGVPSGLPARQAAVRECLDALDHLRRSVPLRCHAVAAAPLPPGSP